MSRAVWFEREARTRMALQTCFWMRGTIFGREVVPEVCMMIAVSSGPAKTASVPSPDMPVSIVKIPAGSGEGVISMTGMD